MLVKRFLDNFNINENVTNEYSNIECLPRPDKLSMWIILRIYGLYFVIIVYKWNLTFAQRLRTTVMSIYFPKREKKRILYLYNECLKKRKRLRCVVKRMIYRKLKAKDSVEENPLRDLINSFEPHLNWLKVFPCLRSKRFICKKLESFGPENRLIGFNTNEGIYCTECYREYEDVFEEIEMNLHSASESGSSQDTNDTDSDSD